MPPAHSLAPGAGSAAVSRVLDALEVQAHSAGLPTATLDRVVIVAGELIANALEHSDQGIRIVLDVSSVAASLWATGGAVGDAPSLPVADATSGRGLFLIAALSDATEARIDVVRYEFQIRPNENPLL